MTSAFTRICITTSCLILLTCVQARGEEQSGPSAPVFAYGIVKSQTKKTYFGTNKLSGCDKELCLVSAPDGYLFAVVHIHTGWYQMRVLTPEGAVNANDVIKFQLPTPERDAQFIEVAAKKDERNLATCDWVDGDIEKYTGGVSCQGWSYKSYRPAPK